MDSLQEESSDDDHLTMEDLISYSFQVAKGMWSFVLSQGALLSGVCIDESFRRLKEGTRMRPQNTPPLRYRPNRVKGAVILSVKTRDILWHTALS
ncbi:vascular endothelial growth factor receptor 2 isoform X1, partial [Lates japonicus]